MSDLNNDKGKVIDINMQKYQKIVKRVVPIVAIALLLVFALASSFYTLKSGENGIVLRMGTVSSLQEQAGLHMKIPFIDQVEIVDVEKVYKMEYGYTTTKAGDEQNKPVSEDRVDEATVIVDGANNNASIALVYLIVQYEISDPIAYKFNVSDPTGTLRLALEDSVRANVQSLTLDEAKTQKEEIDGPTHLSLQKKMDDYGAGIKIKKVVTQNVLLLDNVEAAYQQKENANQYKKGRMEDAEKYQNTVIPQANTEAIQLIENANAYRASTIAKAKAGVAEYNALYTEYLKNKDVLKEKYYVESITEFINNNEIVVDTTEDSDIYKFYNIEDSAAAKRKVVKEEKVVE